MTHDSATHDPSTLRSQADTAGQGHVFRFWDELNPDQRAGLLREVAALDLPLIAKLAAKLGAAAPAAAAGSFAPPDLFPLQRDAVQQAHAGQAARRGAELLAQGKVGYLLVAGGQGSRLGFDGPKGAYPVGPVTGQSLFAWFAARLAAATARHGAPGPWYVMTSATNDAATRAFFTEHQHFGLDPGQVHFFQQAMLPALDLDGKILLKSKHELFLAPNGHGGTLDALARSGLLQHAADHGVETFSYFQVDNPLGRPADAEFLGLHALAGAEMSSKVVAKRDAGEKVGVIGLADGVLGCIEYSDLPADLRDATDPGGRLRFRAGNIAAHAIQREFVERLTADGLDLPWHLSTLR